LTQGFVVLYISAFNSKLCGCLEATLFHEVWHHMNPGVDQDTRPGRDGFMEFKQVLKCFPCA
jgi:hypothetical protein